MADELKIPSFSKAKKLKTKSVTIQAPLPSMDAPNGVVPNAVTYTPPPSYVALTDEQIESCRKGQDIFDFARDIEEIIRVNNRL